MTIVHHHLIYQAKVDKGASEETEKSLQKFLYDLLKVIDMECLIPATVKLSHQKAWTGMVGIITSHVAFHYWTVEKYIQLDIYSCKEFDKKKAIAFLNQYWKASEVKSLFINREVGKEFNVKII